MQHTGLRSHTLKERTDPVVHMLFVVTDTDKVPWRAEGCPRDVEPAGASQELVGQGVGFQEVDQMLELLGVLGADVGGLALQVLGVADTTNERVDAAIAEARVDDDGANLLTGRL